MKQTTLFSKKNYISIQTKFKKNPRMIKKKEKRKKVKKFICHKK
jgi:hypothetical protein